MSIETKPNNITSDLESSNKVRNEVSVTGIILLTVFLILLAMFLVFIIVALWPVPNTTEGVFFSEVKLLFWNLNISEEMRMILIVAVSGALGSLVHDLRSLFWYVGNRGLKRSWLLMYFIIPFIGSILSLLFYFVLRGGLFSSQVTVQDTNPFGFAGIAGLVGMFSNQAAQKLKEVAESLFSTRESMQGADHISAKPSPMPSKQNMPEVDDNDQSKAPANVNVDVTTQS